MADMDAVNFRCNLWIPNFQYRSDRTSQYLDRIINRMNEVLANEYNRHEEGHIDDPSDWNPTFCRLRIAWPSRVSMQAIKQLKRLDEDIELLLF
jgi:hypothetical protein